MARLVVALGRDHDLHGMNPELGVPVQQALAQGARKTEPLVVEQASPGCGDRRQPPNDLGLAAGGPRLSRPTTARSWMAAYFESSAPIKSSTAAVALLSVSSSKVLTRGSAIEMSAHL